ncbi:unnamed protein product [Staurois parvus]|uniref:Uncharacterized protein n=1 Tax=Staurois parvus TaxID=386267 RepID=A0ABN9BXP1_9NEOB|nr:unnamed protein product [Staurois parvus]
MHCGTSHVIRTGTAPHSYANHMRIVCVWSAHAREQGRTDHSETRELPEGPGSVRGPMRCPWYIS